jgi:nitrogenase subunit NifH
MARRGTRNARWRAAREMGMALHEVAGGGGWRKGLRLVLLGGPRDGLGCAWWGLRRTETRMEGAQGRAAVGSNI